MLMEIYRQQFQSTFSSGRFTHKKVIFFTVITVKKTLDQHRIQLSHNA